MRNIRIRKTCALILGAVCLFSAIAQASQAKDKDKESESEREKKEAEAEEDAYRKLGETEQNAALKVMSGKLDLTVPDGASPDVIGTLTAGPLIQMLKLADKSLTKELAMYDKKKVSVSGLMRNHGKYLVVASIVRDFRPHSPPDKKTRGGI